MTMKMIVKPLLALSAAVCLSSCVWQLAQCFVREEYAGNAPHVIADKDGQPASRAWLPLSPDALPAPHAVQSGPASYGPGGIPYGYNSSYQNIVISPYPPYRQLNYKGFSSGSRVWDPYTRKPFYIPASYTIN